MGPLAVGERNHKMDSQASDMDEGVLVVGIIREAFLALPGQLGQPVGAGNSAWLGN